MGGVTAGSRLDRLRALRAKVDQEIAAEERAQALDDRTPWQIATPASRPRPSDERLTLAQLGESPATVRTWARLQGWHVGRTGRIRSEVIEAYAEAHPHLLDKVTR